MGFAQAGNDYSLAILFRAVEGYIELQARVRGRTNHWDITG